MFKKIMQTENRTNLENIAQEIKWRTGISFLCLINSFFISLFFYEEYLFLLSFPFLKLRLVDNFISLYLTENVMTILYLSSTIGCCATLPIMFYQCLCFSLPSLKQSFRNRLFLIIQIQIIYLIITSILNYEWILPTVWSFLLKMAILTTESVFFSIDLKPKIYDFLSLTITSLYLCILCSLLPTIFCIFFELKIIELEFALRHRKTILFICLLISGFITPPMIYTQLIVCLLMYSSIELSVFFTLTFRSFSK